MIAPAVLPPTRAFDHDPGGAQVHDVGVTAAAAALFSLIRVDARWIEDGKLSPKVPFWSGPERQGCPPPFSDSALSLLVPRLVLAYGNGIVLSEIMKARAGFIFGECDDGRPAFAPVFFGDSGAPYALASASATLASQRLEGTHAGRVNSAIVDSELRLAATNVATIRESVARDLGLNLTLLCEGGAACDEA